MSPKALLAAVCRHRFVTPFGALRATLRNCRGSVLLTTAVGATALLGMVALGTEAGGWYLARRSLQGAADAAALAAARVYADTASRGIAKANRYTDGVDSVTVRNETLSANPINLRVTISQSQRASLASAALGISPPAIAASGRAEALQPPNGGGACVLALTGAISFSGSGNLVAPQCALASNYVGGASFIFGNNSCGSNFSVTAWSLISAGSGGAFSTCLSKSPSPVTLTTRPAFYQKPLVSPFAAIAVIATDTGLYRDLLTRPSSNKNATATSSCVSLESNLSSSSPLTYKPAPSVAAGLSPPASGTGVPLYCESNALNSAVIDLQPGTYFFRGSLTMQSGGSLTCSGCATTANPSAGVTLVMIGAGTGGNWGPGNLDLRGGLSLSAPRSSTTFNGIAIWAPGSNGTVTQSNTVTLTANAHGPVQGAVVAQRANVTLTGNSSNLVQSAGDCTVLVVGTLTVTGTGAGLNTAGCGAAGWSDIVPKARVVRLVAEY
jgi:hypothetical protein